MNRVRVVRTERQATGNSRTDFTHLAVTWRSGDGQPLLHHRVPIVFGIAVDVQPAVVRDRASRVVEDRAEHLLERHVVLI